MDEIAGLEDQSSIHIYVWVVMQITCETRVSETDQFPISYTI